MKKNRLFVVGTEATDDTQYYCGGPDPKEALEGLRNMLECHVENVLSGDVECSGISLVVKAMTDEEVEQLPDV